MEIEEEIKQNQLPQIKQENEEEVKTIAKQRKKLKRQKKEQMALQQFSYKNLMVKDLSYEKKIFLFTDLVVDLNLFTDDQFGRSNKFDAISCWRPPVKIEYENNLVHINLDTSVDGLINFDQISNILSSIPNQDAHEISGYISQYNFFLQKYFEKNRELQQILNLICQDKQNSYTLEDYFEEIVLKKMIISKELVNSCYKQNKHISYMIKTRKRNNKVITKYGYSLDLLQLLGINKDNMFRILYQNGPLQYFSSQDKINRMKQSLSVRINQLEAFHQDKEEKRMKDQTIITFDDLQFKCDITMIKDNMSKNENFYVQQVFMIQIALYDISEEVVQQIQNIRQLNPKKQQLQDDLKELYQGLEYETQSEIFMSKFYNI
ncbi:hypothetical protein ABPG72_007732 [Tetrahymena utriculariae]